jgi:hypothetical protein
MRYLQFALIILACLALYACAGVDASVMDTAETMGRGKLSVANTFTMGINFPEWQAMDPEDIFEGDTVHGMYYQELRVGINPQMDISLRGGIHDECQSGKLLLKKQINKSDKSSTAVVFGGGLAKVKPRFWDYWDDPEFEEVRSYEVLSGDIALLFTRRVLRKHFLTLAARSSYHRFSTELKQGDWVSEDVYHAGIRANAKYYVDDFYGMLELGFEAPLSIEGVRQVYPWMGLRAGWDINF